MKDVFYFLLAVILTIFFVMDIETMLDVILVSLTFLAALLFLNRIVFPDGEPIDED